MSDTVQVPIGAQHPQTLERNFVWIMREIVTWMIAFLENKNRKILVNMDEKTRSSATNTDVGHKI